jgi:hypothetical protein
LYINLSVHIKWIKIKKSKGLQRSIGLVS